MSEYQPILLANIDLENSHTRAVYESTGGYAALKKVFAEMSKTDLVELVKESGLRGRGGGGG